MKNKTALLLIELALLIAVFAVAAAVCLGLFAWADTTSKEDTQRDTALLHAQNAAQEIKLAKGDLEQAAARLGGDVVGGIWEKKLEDGCILRVESRETDTKYLGRARVTVLDTDGSVLARIDACWQEDGS